MRSLIRTIVISGFVAVSAHADSLALDCSIAVEEEIRDVSSYRPRQGRCEGIFTQTVSNRIALRVVGYQIGRFPDATEELIFPDVFNLKIAGAAEMTEPQLIAVSLRSSDNYQMDTRSLREGGFAWPTDVLRTLVDPPLGRDLAVLSCDGRCFGGPSQPKLHPVLVDASSADSRPGRTTLILTSDVDLKVLRVVVSSQETGDVLINYQTRTGFIPARKGTRVRLSGQWSGAASLFVEATTHDDRRSTYEALLWPPESH